MLAVGFALFAIFSGFLANKFLSTNRSEWSERPRTTTSMRDPP
jgi:hypothetical protein